MRYKWILFDADDTIFSFDDLTGLSKMLLQYDIELTHKEYLEYKQLNNHLFAQFQKGEISANDIKTQRFTKWAKQLDMDPVELNAKFMEVMIDVCKPLDGALELLDFLKDKVNLGIITNGFTDLQVERLKRNGLTNYFDILVVSEEVGVAKPNIKIFEHEFSLMDNPNLDEVLMVGDRLDSDIIGGNNAGVDTCWINLHNKTNLEDIMPTYTVPSLTSLKQLLHEHIV